MATPVAVIVAQRGQVQPTPHPVRERLELVRTHHDRQTREAHDAGGSVTRTTLLTRRVTAPVGRWGLDGRTTPSATWSPARMLMLATSHRAATSVPPSVEMARDGQVLHGTPHMIDERWLRLERTRELKAPARRHGYYVGSGTNPASREILIPLPGASLAFAQRKTACLPRPQTPLRGNPRVGSTPTVPMGISTGQGRSRGTGSLSSNPPIGGWSPLDSGGFVRTPSGRTG